MWSRGEPAPHRIPLRPQPINSYCLLITTTTTGRRLLIHALSTGVPTAVDWDAYGCSLQWLRLQPAVSRVAARGIWCCSLVHLVCSPGYTVLQPGVHRVAAWCA